MTHATQKKERVAQNVKAIYLQPSVPRLNRCRAASGKKTNNKKKKAVRVLHLPNVISRTAITERTNVVLKLLTLPIYLLIEQAPDGNVPSFNPIRPAVPILRLNPRSVFKTGAASQLSDT